MNSTLLEVCIDSLASADEANAGGAHRLEVCSDLEKGGMTPSLGLVQACIKSGPADLMIMIRPRAGDFCYSDDEFEVMRLEIEAYKKLAADASEHPGKIKGFVFGLLNDDHSIDQKRSKELIELSRPYSVTFHRAFDWTPDPNLALEVLIDISVDRLLSSGQQASAEAGMQVLKELQIRAQDRIIIMPGAGVNEKNAASILKNVGCRELHASARGAALRKETKALPLALGAQDLMHEGRKLCSSDKVKALVQVMNDELGCPPSTPS